MKFTTRQSRQHASSRQHGFTLVELMVYFMLFGMLILVVLNMFISSLELKVRDSSSTVLDQESEFLLAHLGYELRNANSVTAPAPSGTSGSALTLVTDQGTVVYELSSGRLIRTLNATPMYLTSDKVQVQSVSFTNQSNSESTVMAFTISMVPNTDSSTPGFETRQISNTVALR